MLKPDEIAQALDGLNAQKVGALGMTFITHRRSGDRGGGHLTGRIGLFALLEEVYAGESVSAVKSIQPAAEIVEELAEQTEQHLRQWATRLGGAGARQVLKRRESALLEALDTSLGPPMTLPVEKKKTYALLVSAVLFLAACSGNGGGPGTAPRLVSISVTPANPSVTKGLTQQLVAMGAFEDGNSHDLTAQVMWSSSNTAVATVSNAAGSQGLATAVEAGAVTVSASLEDVTGSTALAVTLVPRCVRPVEFVQSPQTPGLDDDIREVLAGDLNGDHSVDLVLISNGPNKVYLNDRTGQFSLVQTFPSSADMSGALGDLDGDGDLDLLVVGSRAFLFFNDGSGQFTAGPQLGPEHLQESGIADLNGDGLADLILTGGFSPSGVSSEVWMNTRASPGTFTWHSFVALPRVESARHGSAGGQAIYAGRGGSDTRVFLDAGNGAFHQTWEIPENGDPNYGADFGDVNGDGLVDLVLGSHFEGSRTWLGTGGGHFSSGSPLGSPRFVRQLKLGDLDNDGDLDVAIANWGRHFNGPNCGASEGCYEPDEVWLNDGTGRFTLGQELGDTSSRSVAIADVDGDQDLDLVIGELYATWPKVRATRIWLNRCLGN